MATKRPFFLNTEPTNAEKMQMKRELMQLLQLMATLHGENKMLIMTGTQRNAQQIRENLELCKCCLKKTENILIKIKHMKHE